MDIKKLLGLRIKQVREAMSLSQGEFAPEIEVSQGHLSAIERGEKMPGGEILVKLKQYSDVNCNWLLAIEDVDESLMFLKGNSKDSKNDNEESREVSDLRAQVRILQDTILKMSSEKEFKAGDVEPPMRATVPNDATIQSGSKLLGAKT